MSNRSRAPLNVRKALGLGRAGWVLMVILCLSTATEAFLAQTYRTRSGDVVRQRWSRGEVTFVIDETGSDNMAAATTISILRDSFNVWADVSSASLSLVDDGLSNTLSPSSSDRRNLIIFDERGEWLDPPPGSGVIAVTRIESNSTGLITDADIIFNGRDFEFTSGDLAGAINLKDVAVHEVGHLFGLDHTPLQGPAALRPTMNPFYGGDGPGEASSLEADDIAGISYLYPGPTFQLATGIIAGSVFNTIGEAVFGAHITAQNMATGEIFSTLSGAYPDEGGPGSYLLPGLTSGSYRLQLAPVGGGITDTNFGGIFENFGTGFPLEYYDNATQSSLAILIDIEPGQQVAKVDFSTGFEAVTGSSIVPLSLANNTPDSSGPYSIQVLATEAQRVSLTYKVEGAIGDNGNRIISMRPVDEAVYIGDIPGQPIGSRVLYRISATSTDGSQVTYPSSADQWLRFDVIPLSGLPLAFTVLRDDGVVGVFDTGSDLELARIAVGSDPIQILHSHDSELLFVSNLASNNLSIVKAATFQTLASVDVSAQPLDLAQAPDGSIVYVVNSDASSLSALDVETLHTSEMVIPGLVRGPFGIAATSQNVFVTDMGTDEIIALNLNGDIVARAPGPASPRSLAVSPDGGTLYSTSFTTAQLAFFDTQTLQLTDLVELPLSGSFALAVAPDGGKLYVTGHVDNVVVVVDAINPGVIKSIPMGDNPRAISFAPSGEMVMVTSAESGQIHVINTSSDTVLEAYDIRGRPRGIAVVQPPRPKADLPTAVLELPLPNEFSLSPPFPNPFNSAIQVRFTIPDDVTLSGEHASLNVYDILGQRMRTLASGIIAPGAHTVFWDGRDDAGNPVAAGAYVVLLRAARARAASKIMYLK